MKRVGTLMNEQRRAGARAVAMFMAVVLYAAVLIYTGVHNFNLMSRTVPDDQRFFAITALLCLEGAAIFLPLAIHFWLSPGPQRTVGYILYGVNFAVVIINTVLDAITNRSEAVPDWLQLYATFIMPATPIIVGVGIAFIFLLDPSKKVHDAAVAVQAAAVEALAIRMREAADSEAVDRALVAGAFRDVQRLTRELVGEVDDAPSAVSVPSGAGAGPALVRMSADMPGPEDVADVADEVRRPKSKR